MAVVPYRVWRIILNCLVALCAFLVTNWIVGTSISAAATTGSWIHLIVSPTAAYGGLLLTSGTLTATAYADAGEAVEGVQFKANNLNLGPEVTSGGCGVAWDTTRVADGRYAITVVAHDSHGTVTTSASTLVNVQNATPRVLSVNISSAGVTDAGNPAYVLSWTSDQATSGIVEYGPTNVYGSANANGVLGFAHAQLFTDLETGTTYHFRITALNAVGGSSMTSDAMLVAP